MIQKEETTGDPLVSIIVPVYNVARFLPPCFKSLIAQTYRQIEVILVNDGSTDGSGELCEKLATTDARVKVFHKRNGGLSDARNYGIARAAGEFIILVDSDDMVSSTYVAHLVKPLIARPGISLSVGNYVNVPEEAEIHDVRENVASHQVSAQILTTDDVLRRMCRRYVPPVFEVAWGKCYKKELFDTISYPVGMIHEDTATTYKFYLLLKSIAFIDEPLYYYRQRHGSIMKSDARFNNTDLCAIFLEKDRIFRQQCSQDLVLRNRAYCVSHLLDAVDLSTDPESTKEIIATYRTLYDEGLPPLKRKTAVKAFLRRWFPYTCRLIHRTKRNLRQARQTK